MPRGGRRAGKPGTAYPNRSDLNGPVPVQAAPSQRYGERAASERAQRQMPVAPPPAPTSAPMPAAPPAPRRATVPLTAPTQRPDEPLTAGIASGPGPGPEALGGVGLDPTADELRALYSRFPHIDALRELVEELDEEVNQ